LHSIKESCGGFTPPRHDELVRTTRSRPLVIVVDDDSAVRNSLKFSLEIEGFSVRTYSDGQELLSQGDASASSCLIVDHNLPGISGLETIARLREEHVNVPAILITTHPTLATREHARQAHIPIVEKPFLGNALIDQVHAALGLGPDGIGGNLN
jgi:FixJ family two-component response regulator